MGDSISAAYGINRQQGWANLLQARLQPDSYRVINASVSVDTTANGLHGIRSQLQQYNPAIIIIELGGNDGLRGLPLAEMKNNLGHIIELCLESGSQVLLLGIRMPPNYGHDYLQRFAAIYQQLAQQYHIPLVGQILANIAEHPELMQPDGIHPRTQAQHRLLDNIWPRLAPMLDPNVKLWD